MSAKTKTVITNTTSVFFMAAALLIMIGVGICISLHATPSELYARLMNRPMDTPIIQIQSATDSAHKMQESGLS